MPSPAAQQSHHRSEQLVCHGLGKRELTEHFLPIPLWMYAIHKPVHNLWCFIRGETMCYVLNVCVPPDFNVETPTCTVIVSRDGAFGVFKVRWDHENNHSWWNECPFKKRHKTSLSPSLLTLSLFSSLSPTWGHNREELLLLLLFSHWVVSDTFVTPGTVASQAPRSMGFLRQEN